MTIIERIIDLIKTLPERFRMKSLLFLSAFLAIFFALILFVLSVLDDKFLQKYPIDSLVKKCQGYAFLFFLFFTSFFVLLCLFLVGRSITKRIIEKRNQKRMFRNLSSHEKDFLSYYIDCETTEQYIAGEDIADITISRLLNKGIIDYAQPIQQNRFVITPSTYEVLDKNRKLLEPELSSKKREKFQTS